MGYTHYWEHAEITADAWKKIRSDFRAILAATDVKVSYEYDQPSKRPQNTTVMRRSSWTAPAPTTAGMAPSARPPARATTLWFALC